MSDDESDAVQSRKSANSDNADAVLKSAPMPITHERQSDAFSVEPSRISHFDECERFNLQYENLPIRLPDEHTQWVPLTAALLWIDRHYAVDIDELCRPPLSMFGQSDEHVRESLERAWSKLAQKASVGSVGVRGRPYNGSDTEREERSLTVDDLLNCKWFGWGIGDLSIHLVGAVYRFDPNAEDYDLARGGMVNFSFVRVEREGLMRLWELPDADKSMGAAPSQQMSGQGAAILASSAKKAEMLLWLQEQLDGVELRSLSKADFRERAIRKFVVTKFAFDTAWRVAVGNRPQWQVAGRRRRNR